MALSLAREALLSGWRLIRHAPLAVLAWWLIRMVEQRVEYWIYATSGGATLPATFVTLAFEAFLISAVFRALLHPAKPGLAWLRVGWVEAKMSVLLAVAGLIALVIALPISIAASYGFLSVHWPGLGSVVLSIGLVAAVLALLRFAALPAMLVDEGLVDIRAALDATRGRYWVLAILVLGFGLIERCLGAAWAQLLPRSPPTVLSVTLYDPKSPGSSPDIPHVSPWPSPRQLLESAGDQLFGIALLIFVSAAIASVWRASKQTLD